MSRRHVVREGECFALIAARYGWSDGRALYEHNDNANLRRRRPNAQLLVPGDIVVIPDKSSYQTDVSTGRWHRFIVDAPREEVCLRIQLDDLDAPHANVPYEISVDGGAWVEGVTDRDGVLEHVVQATARSAEVLLYPTDGACVIPLELELGTSGPVDVDDYAHARLDALGYYDEQAEDESTDELREYLDAEQRALESDGADDGPTDEELLADLRDVFEAAHEAHLLDEAWDEEAFDALSLGEAPGETPVDAVPPARDPHGQAIVAFQQAHGLDLTGKLDAPTRRRLEAEYDGVD